MTFEDWVNLKFKPECKGCKYYRKLQYGIKERCCHYLLDTGEKRETEPWEDGKCDKWERGD